MYIKISWNEDFDTLMMHLWSKYGKELFNIDGIGEQMDLHKFSKKFFSTSTPTADVSIDGNANVVARTSIEYNHELAKPLKKYNSYYLLWKELKKQFGLEFANKTIEKQLTGDIYINDFTDVSLPYSYHPKTSILTNLGEMTMDHLFNKFFKQVNKLPDREEVDLRNQDIRVWDGEKYVKILCVLRHKSHTDLIEFDTKDRKHPLVTTDHPVILSDLTEKMAGSISIGDKIKRIKTYQESLDKSNKTYASFLEIHGKKIIPFKGEYVYDIQTENGVFECNGILCHNCFNYSTFDIALNGLEGISKRLNITRPKSFECFIRQVEQHMVIAANSTLGATGYADLFIVGAHFVDEIKKTGKDGHIAVTDLKTYLIERLKSFIYTVN